MCQFFKRIGTYNKLRRRAPTAGGSLRQRRRLLRPPLHQIRRKGRRRAPAGGGCLEKAAAAHHSGDSGRATAADLKGKEAGGNPMEKDEGWKGAKRFCEWWCHKSGTYQNRSGYRNPYGRSKLRDHM
uniref:Uncharacterized protein n=1 Tax=Oryza meridionalis TaxID=40149 RepID=A0A0E0DCW3_9ORYZ